MRWDFKDFEASSKLDKVVDVINCCNVKEEMLSDHVVGGQAG